MTSGRLHFLGNPRHLTHLLNSLRKSWVFSTNFSLQYEDPDFNNALVNLTDITDLPDKPTLKIITLVSTPTPSTASTDDTEILPFSPESRSSRSPWPDTFEIPNFPVDIEYRLRQGNLLYMRDKTYLQVPRDMKHEILEKLIPAMKNSMMLQQH